jgi:hypothetical protein
VGDEITRWPLLSGNVDRGLRGGRVRYSGGNVLRIRLTGVRWVTDARATGTARWNQATGKVTARLTVTLRGGAKVRLTARWRVYAEPGQVAVISGTAGHADLAAAAPAP